MPLRRRLHPSRNRAIPSPTWCLVSPTLFHPQSSLIAMNRLTVRGKYIYDGERKFFARGVSYGPFTLNSRGERYPEPERTAADFALMRELGVNLVRTYVPPPPWMFELAAQHGLRLMVGMPWPFHMAFLDSATLQRDLGAAVCETARSMTVHSDVHLVY